MLAMDRSLISTTSKFYSEDYSGIISVLSPEPSSTSVITSPSASSLLKKRLFVSTNGFSSLSANSIA
jgi:hypothetical protein